MDLKGDDHMPSYSFTHNHCHLIFSQIYSNPIPCCATNLNSSATTLCELKSYPSVLTVYIGTAYRGKFAINLGQHSENIKRYS